MRKIGTVLVLAGLAGWAGAQTVEEWLKTVPLDNQRVFLGLEVWQWIGLSVTLVLSIFAAMIGWFIAGVVIKWKFRASPSDLSPEARRGIRRSFGLIVAGWLWELALDGLHVRDVSFLYNMAATIVVVGCVWLAISVWDAFCDALIRAAADVSRRAERILIPILRKVVRAVIMIGGLFIGLWWIGTNVAGIVAGLGIGGVAIALAAKDSVENIFGSFTILFDMPFAIGDWIRINDIYGKVEQINLRSTRIRLATNALVTLPNSNLIRASVENVGDLSRRRIYITLPVALDTPPEHIKRFCAELREELKKIDLVEDDTVKVAPTDVQSTGLVLIVYCWLAADTWDLELEAREKIITTMLDQTKKQRVVLQGVPRFAPIEE